MAGKAKIYGDIKVDNTDTRGPESTFAFAADGLVTASYNTTYNGDEEEASLASLLPAVHPTGGLTSLKWTGSTVTRIGAGTIFRITRNYIGAKDDALTRTISLQADSANEPIETHEDFKTWIGEPDDDGLGSGDYGAVFKARGKKEVQQNDAGADIDVIALTMDEAPFSHFQPEIVDPDPPGANIVNPLYGVESYLAPRLVCKQILVTPSGVDGWGDFAAGPPNENPIYNVGKTYDTLAGAPSIGLNRNWLLTSIGLETLGGALRITASFSASSIQTDAPWNPLFYDASGN